MNQVSNVKDLIQLIIDIANEDNGLAFVIGLGLMCFAFAFMGIIDNM